MILKGFTIVNIILCEAGFCPYGKAFTSEFSVQLVHVQDASSVNMKDIPFVYYDIFNRLLEDSVPVSVGLAAYLDDGDSFSNLVSNISDEAFCFQRVYLPTKLTGANDVFTMFNDIPIGMAKPEVFGSGFKAMSMAAYNGKDAQIQWDKGTNTLRMLVVSSSSPPKVNSVECPLIKNMWSECTEWKRSTQFEQLGTCGSVRNQPRLLNFRENIDSSLIILNHTHRNGYDIYMDDGVSKRWHSLTRELKHLGVDITHVDSIKGMKRYITSRLKQMCTLTVSTTPEVDDAPPCEGYNPYVCLCKGSLGADYVGTIKRSENGDYCKNWNEARYYTELPYNYCRNPDESGKRPWCYLEGGGWDYCSVPECGCKNLDVEKCGCSQTSLNEYRGTVNKTEAGVPCQAWLATSPHGHGYFPLDPQYKWDNLDENYCRNPHQDGRRPWCYEMSDDQKWDYCDIKTCE